ncbi:MAG: hypothetical protein LUQ07_02760 [Methanospirillum sp.]|nr:hypothetical protein [Methanospirillum sp.]
MVSLGKGMDHGNTNQRERSFVAGTMNIMETITVISLVAAIANGIGMALVYLRYIRVIRGAFAAHKATPDGEVEIVDLLSDTLRPFLR